MLSILLIVASAATPPSCGSPERAAAALEDNLAQVVPGRSLESLKEALGPALAILDLPDASGRRDLTILVEGRDGNRHVTQPLECTVDSVDEVVKCRQTEERYQTQYVAQADWQRVQKGLSVEAAYRMICKPGDRLLGPPWNEQTSLEYLVVMTEAVFHEGTCAGRILAEDGIVVAKETMCE